jgi:membrane protease YdiL (CAAX protease family)
LNHLARRLVQWKVAPAWYGVVFIFPLALVGSAVVVMNLAAGVPLDWSERPAHGQIAASFFLLLVLPAGAPLAEEIGWRGLALPRLLAVRSPWTASLILGAVWSLWHLPILVSDPGLRPPLPFLLMVLPLSIIFTWIHIETGGSLAIAVVFHAWYDVVLMSTSEMIPRSEYDLLFWLLFAAQSAAAILVVLLVHRNSNTAAKRGAMIGPVAAAANA